MTPVKPQISKFKAEKSCQVGLTCHGGSTHERLLSESSRSYMLTFRLKVINSSVQIVQGLLGLNVKRGSSVQNVNNTEASNTSICRDYTLTSTNDLTRLTNAHE